MRVESGVVVVGVRFISTVITHLYFLGMEGTAKDGYTRISVEIPGLEEPEVSYSHVSNIDLSWTAPAVVK